MITIPPPRGRGARPHPTPHRAGRRTRDPGAGRAALGLLAALGLACASPSPDPQPVRYVFAWPFLDQPMDPRGGTTRGPEVTLATAPSDAWRRLHAPGLETRERDRAAILALAGDYRASFDFLETVLFEPGSRPARPYRSWGTERIYVLEERPDFVSLQHVLVMFVEDDEGRRHGPFVQKHWRQDWRYEPERLLVFAGDRRFETRPVPADARRGAWSQTVYQVDDSPRYGSVGRWVHDDEASTWVGNEAWRPLPRREHTVRDDYDVLAGRNRLTILPTGWIHEQDNTKLVGEDPGETRALAREIGVNRYDRLEGFDFGAADAYWEATAPFWALVREGFAARAAASARFRVARRCGGEPGFSLLFRQAQRMQQPDPPSRAEQRAEVERILDCLVGTE